MANIITINVAEMAIGRSSDHIRTSSIGSCIVVVLYDPIAKVGGMAHIMLPSRRQREGGDNENQSATDSEAPAKYVDEGIDRLLREIEEAGGERERIEAKLIGGARMFRILGGTLGQIGDQNIEKSKKHLEELDIPVKSDDTGGTMGRVADLDCETGLVEIITKI